MSNPLNTAAIDAEDTTIRLEDGAPGKITLVIAERGEDVLAVHGTVETIRRLAQQGLGMPLPRSAYLPRATAQAAPAAPAASGGNDEMIALLRQILDRL